MRSLRALFRHHRPAALLLLVLTLCVKAMLPPGYMVAPAGKQITVQLCYDGLEHRTAQILLPMETPPGGVLTGHDGRDGKMPDGSGMDQHCAFSALAMGVLGTAAGLALALPAPFHAGGLPIAAASSLPVAHPYLRPPLRGPPARV